MTYAVGDKVELLDDGGFTGSCKAGDVGTVTRVAETGSVFVDGGWTDGGRKFIGYFYEREVRPYYEAGDKVELLENDYDDIPAGRVGTVVRSDSSLVRVEGVWEGGPLNFYLSELKPYHGEPAETKDSSVDLQLQEAQAQLEIERAHLATAQRSIETLRLEKEQALRLETYWRQRASALASSKETYRRRTKRLRAERDVHRHRVEHLEAEKATAIMQRDYWENKSRQPTVSPSERYRAELLEGQLLKAALNENGGADFVKLVEALVKLSVAYPVSTSA